MTEDDIIISVCIITRHRPEGLEHLLNSLVQQRGAPPFEVIVIDNGDDDRSKKVAESFRSSLNLVYDREPVRGLCHARNRSVAVSRGTYLAFIDDDEEAVPTWLATMLRLIGKYKSHGVFGPVYERYSDDVPVAIRECRNLKRYVYPEGEELPFYHTHTSNGFVLKSALPDTKTPFDPVYNLSGGEDIDLFKRMILAGSTMVSSAEGTEVYEYRPLERANLRWVMRRSIRNGAHMADEDWAGMRYCARLRNAFSSLGLCIKQFFMAVKLRRGDQHVFVSTCLDACENMGRFLRVTTGYLYQEKKRS